nr:hypothetical protein [Tanacetum cinerariifolium]
HAQPEDTYELLRKLLEDLQIINKELAEYINSLSWNHLAFYDDDDEHSIQYKEYLENSANAIAPILPTEEPDNSLSMGDEHLSTILEMESTEVIKSSVENLVPISSEFEDFFDNESECDVPVCDDITTIFNPLFDSDDDFPLVTMSHFIVEDVLKENFKFYSNHLFDNEIISSKIDLHHFNAESDLIESLLNRDISTISYPKIDYFLDEFSGELAQIDLVPPGINKADFDLSDATIEPLSPSHIPVVDSDSHMEEIDLFLAMDNLMPPGIENDDYDSEGDIYFLKELLSDDPLPLPKNESSNFDHHDDTSFTRPPSEPPDVEVFFDFKPDTGVLTTKAVKGISEHYVLMPNILPTLPTLDPDLDFTPSHDSLGFRNKIFDPRIFIEVQYERFLSRDEFSISFIRDPLCPNIDTLLLFSSENEDKVFKPESLLNRDISTISYPKIDYFLDKFSGELAQIDLVPPGINKADFDHDEEICLIEELFYETSSPRPLEESNFKKFLMLQLSLSLHLISPLRIVTLIWRRSTYFLLWIT